MLFARGKSSKFQSWFISDFQNKLLPKVAMEILQESLKLLFLQIYTLLHRTNENLISSGHTRLGLSCEAGRN